MSKPRTMRIEPADGQPEAGGAIMTDKVPPVAANAGTVDIEAFAKNLARMVEEGGKALAAYMKPREKGQLESGLSDEVQDMVKTLGEVINYWLADPSRAVELQSRPRHG